MTGNRTLVKPVPATDDSIAEAARALADGKLVVLPTETVYGLGADATNAGAVAAIFAAKTRPSFNPLIIHAASLEAAEEYVVFDDHSRKLACAFWPGPFTLVLPRREPSRLAEAVTAGLDTVAVRVPAHPAAQALLRAFGRPVAAPSANLSGRVSPTRARDAADELGGAAAMILDGGPCTKGLESTIAEVTGNCVTIHRPGTVTAEEIAEVTGLEVRGSGPSPAITTPGQLESHYAPRAAVRLNATEVAADECLLAFGEPVPAGAAQTLNLSPRGDLVEAAANLFTMLRALDNRGAAMIAVMPIPDTGIGVAINDRLRRAAAPRPGEADA